MDEDVGSVPAGAAAARGSNEQSEQPWTRVVLLQGCAGTSQEILHRCGRNAMTPEIASCSGRPHGNVEVGMDSTGTSGHDAG